MRLCVLLAVLSGAGFSQSLPELPGCESRTEVRQVIESKLDWKSMRSMKDSDQVSGSRTTT